MDEERSPPGDGRPAVAGLQLDELRARSAQENGHRAERSVGSADREGRD